MRNEARTFIRISLLLSILIAGGAIAEESTTTSPPTIHRLPLESTPNKTDSPSPQSTPSPTRRDQSSSTDRPNIRTPASQPEIGAPAGTVGQAIPKKVMPLYSTRSVWAYADDSRKERKEALEAGAFPLPVLEESPDGQMFRVKHGGSDLWVSKRDVRPEDNQQLRQMCSTVNTSAKTGATRNANEGCR